MATATKRTPRKKAAAKKAPAKKTTKRTPRKKTTARKATKMTAQHKSALALGRQEGAVVREYLDALEAHKPKRGRRVTPDDIRAKIEKIDAQAADAKASTRLLLVQERLDLEHRLEIEEVGFDMSALEERFIKVARKFAERKGISFSAFREVGVPAAVLQNAGITRSMK